MLDSVAPPKTYKQVKMEMKLEGTGGHLAWPDSFVTWYATQSLNERVKWSFQTNRSRYHISVLYAWRRWGTAIPSAAYRVDMVSIRTVSLHGIGGVIILVLCVCRASSTVEFLNLGAESC